MGRMYLLANATRGSQGGFFAFVAAAAPVLLFLFLLDTLSNLLPFSSSFT